MRSEGRIEVKFVADDMRAPKIDQSEGTVAEDFADKVARLASKAHLAEVIKQSLYELLAEPAASAVVYLGGYEVLQNPEVFEGKLRDMFGTGTS